MERAKKALFQLFDREGLKITAEGGRKIVDYLDVVLDLSKGSYCPFVKPNTSTKYVSTQSNHPKKIIDTIPKGIAKRLSRNSSNVTEFNKHSAHFKEALKQAGHDPNIKYEEEQNDPKTRRRKKNVIYFNPPWSMNVRTKIGQKFLSLVRKHFPKGSPLHSIFNTSTLKLSYSTMPNMSQHIAAHNKKVLKNAEGRQDPVSYGCNCEGGVESCPLEGECKVPNLVYKAEVEAGGESRFYIGQTAITFKKRYRLHKSNTKLGKKKSTALTRHLVELEEKGIVPDRVKWSKVQIVKPRQRGQKVCQLCLSEKTNIAVGGVGILNKRGEVMTRCRHQDRLMLINSLNLHETVQSGREEEGEEDSLHGVNRVSEDEERKMKR